MSTNARCVALVGPYLSGKTSLMEAMLHAAGALTRKGSVRDGNTVGDASPESRNRNMSTEILPARFNYLGDDWTVLDCPGSVEFLQEAMHGAAVADIAVVVCEPDPARAIMLAPILRFLDARNIPHIIFINKIDTVTQGLAETMEALQGVSGKPVVVRHIPVVEGETVAGYVDLISERAYSYNEGAASELIKVPEALGDDTELARQELMEALADFDDTLLEALLEEATPARDEIYAYFKAALADGHVVPVMLGAAERDHGVRRLLKALRHDTPDVSRAAARFEVSDGTAVQIFKTYHAQHQGKQNLGRVLSGTLNEGDNLGGERLGNLASMHGAALTKVASAEAGDVVAIGRLDAFETGQMLTAGGADKPDAWPVQLSPIYAIALHAEKRSDEVKLSGALQRLAEEDCSYRIEANPETHQLLLWGQGDQHLQVGVARLQSKYHIAVETERPQTPYRETIRKATEQHSRFKRQSGGHGQFGDVVIDIAPLPRGEGFAFEEKVVGGSVPRQFIPAVETGVREFLHKGPLGFPVVDLVVTLKDGKHHPVDSSEQAFKTAGRLAMSEGLPNCNPILLEPILKVQVHIPSEYTANIQRLLAGRRGQILGFDAREGWAGWDRVDAFLPQSEMSDMIIELRSLTLGVGTFDWEFDHLQELSGKLAEDIVEARKQAEAH